MNITDTITENKLPYRWAICERCKGEGKHDHPAFANGITSSEWAEWDDDERESYQRGEYDVPCTVCGGSGKVKEPDVSRMTYAQKRIAAEARRLARWRVQWAREDAAIRRAESGGYDY